MHSITGINQQRQYIQLGCSWLTNCRPKSSVQRQHCHSPRPELLTRRHVLLNSPLFWWRRVTAAQRFSSSRLKEMSWNLFPLAGLIFSPRLLVLINEVDKQLFRENNSVLILRHSSAPLSIWLISVMRWQVSFLTPVLRRCNHARTPTRAGTLCLVTIHYSRRFTKKLTDFEFESISCLLYIFASTDKCHTELKLTIFKAFICLL